MSVAYKFWIGGLALGLAVALGILPAAAEDRLQWSNGRVNAQIETWDLATLLEKISAATGWQVYLEPETEHQVSTTFHQRPVSEALPMLFGPLNYALVPQAGEPPKLFVFRTGINQATELVRQPASPDADEPEARVIGNELILTLKPGANIDEIARRLGAKVVGRNDELNLFRLQFEDDAAAARAREQLKFFDDVAAVDSNFIVDRPPAPQQMAGGSPLPFSLKPSVGDDGGRVIVGLVDTGIQAFDQKYEDWLLKAIQLAGPADLNPNLPSHATSMFDTILRAMSLSAEGSSLPVGIVSVDIYGNHSTTSTYDIALGIHAALKEGATIINLSLGSPGQSSYLQTLIQNAAAQNVLFFGAAGNQPVTTPIFPAAYPDVVAVTAGDRQGNIAPYANRGDFVDVTAPGVSFVQFNGKTYLVSGTSAATAFTSGLAASIAARTGQPLKTVEAQIRAAWPVKKP